ncbi:24969_t:CDS:2 [Cetraspora pellucida]|uniref:24969_t:CDS:1 n=1 Tax=Cetraspora pellucida TaxID=1433469 RepID=A0A9N9CDT4_9GLOM|nr:24969_t:CDS:2 [Cetraspora pellucida]
METLQAIDNGVKYTREETIILNVGGIKYETYPSTLTAFPDTLLGTMFQERNRSMLHPRNGNEYFIDRNGYAFRYILEFYRNGKILWNERSDKNTISVSREELDQEIDYFQIPIKDVSLASGEKTVAAKVDAFVAALKELIHEAMDQLQTEIHLKFYEDGQPGLQYWSPAYRQSAIVENILKPFNIVGYVILQQFGDTIERHLKSEIPEISWLLNEGTPRFPPDLPPDFDSRASFIGGSGGPNGTIGPLINNNRPSLSSFAIGQNSINNQQTNLQTNINNNSSTQPLFGTLGNLLAQINTNNQQNNISSSATTTGPGIGLNLFSSVTTAPSFNLFGTTTGVNAFSRNPQTVVQSNGFGTFTNVQTTIPSFGTFGFNQPIIQTTNDNNGFGFNSQPTSLPSFGNITSIQSGTTTSFGYGNIQPASTATSFRVAITSPTFTTNNNQPNRFVVPGNFTLNPRITSNDDTVFRRRPRNDGRCLDLIIKIVYDYSVANILANTCLAND